MWEKIKGIVKGIRTIIKYASLFVVILSILGFAADKTEDWMKENEPKAGEGEN